MVPLIENAGAVFGPKARLFILDADQHVVAGPLVIARRRSYHRSWLLGFVGVTSRATIEQWRDHLVAVEEPNAHD